MGNAIKFTSKEAGRNITIKAEKKNNELNVCIKDTGSVINPEIKPKLFSKFVTDSPGATGIGLYISKSIVEAHGEVYGLRITERELHLRLVYH